MASKLQPVFFLSLFLAMLLGTVAGCSCEHKKRTVQEIRALVSYPLPRRIHPENPSFRPELFLARHLWAPLIYVDGKGKVQSDLLLSWGSPKLNQWSFKLRPHLKWSDGSAMTKEQIVKALQKSLQSPQPRAQGIGIKNISANEEGISIELSAHSASFLTEIGSANFPIFDTRLVPYALEKGGRVSGPYQIRSFHKSRIVLEPNPYFPRAGNRRIVPLIYEFRPTDEEIAQAFLTQEADYAEVFRDRIRSQTLKLLADADVTLQVYPDANLIGSVMFGEAGFQTISVPDRQFLLRYIWERNLEDVGPDQVAHGLQVDGFMGAISRSKWREEIRKLPRSPTKKLNIRVLVSRHRDSLQAERCLRYLQEHPEITLSLSEVDEQSADLSELNQARRNSDLFFLNVFFNTPDPDTTWRFFLNLQHYQKAPVNSSRLDAGLKIASQLERARFYQELEIMQLKNPFRIPLARMEVYRIFSSRLKGIGEYWGGIVPDLSRAEF